MQTIQRETRGILTKADVLRALADAPRSDLSDGHGTGLILRTNKGPAHWVGRFDQKPVRLGYVEADGLLDPVEARKLRDAMRAKLATGQTPQAEAKAAKVEARSALTFGEFATLNRARIGPEKEPGNSVWVRDMTLKVGKLAALRPAEITVDDIAEALQPYWKGRNPTALRLRQRIEGVLNAAYADGLIPASAAWMNPALKRGPIQFKFKRVKRRKRHFASLAHQELGAFLPRLRAKPTMSALALEWCILGASRITATLLATWAEIDLKRRVWTIPPEHLKTEDDTDGLPHAVPITRAMLRVLRQALPRGRKPRSGDLIFPNPRGRSKTHYVSNSILQLLEHFELPLDANGKRPTTHGFRTTFATWAQEQGYPRHLIRCQLGHTVSDEADGGDTADAYLRSKLLEQRRPLAAAWAAYCSPPKPEKGEAAPAPAAPELRLVA